MLAQQHFDGFNDRTDVLFGARSTDSYRASGIRQLAGEMESYHKDGNLGKEFADLLGNIDSVQIGHLVVQKDEIWWRFDHFSQRFGSGSSLATNSPLDLLLKNGLQIMTDGGIVIDKKNTNHATPSPPEDS